MNRIAKVAVLTVLAAAGSAMGQYAITPGANGTSTTNGWFNMGTVPTSPTAAGAGVITADFRATTNAATDNQFNSWWWFRGAGDTREFALSNGTAGGVTSTRTATIGTAAGLTNNGGYDFSVTGATYTFTSSLRYVIVNTGAGGPQIVSSNVITNTGASTLSLALFAYNDFDPNGSFGHPYSYVADLDGFGNGGFTMSSGPGPTTINWIGYGANAYQATPYSTLAGSLSNSLVNNLDNTVAGSPGDFTGAFQWNLVLEPGASATVYSGFSINAPAIPAPGAMALIGLGGILAGRRRRA